MLSSISERTFTQIALHWDLSTNWVWLLYTCLRQFTVVGFLYHGCNLASLFPHLQHRVHVNCFYLRYIVLSISLAPVGYLKAFRNPREMFFFSLHLPNDCGEWVSQNYVYYQIAGLFTKNLQQQCFLSFF